MVRFAVGGRATNGVDYGIIGSAVTIPVGASSMQIKVRPVDDNRVEEMETVTLTLGEGPAYQLSALSSSTIRIADNDEAPSQPVIPTITLGVSDSGASEAGPTAGSVTLHRSGDTSTPLTVKFTIGGTATNGVDYQTLTPSVTIPAGSSFADVVITPIDDSIHESTETVTLSLVPDTAYTFAEGASATLRIADNDAAANSLTWTALPTLPDGRSEGMGTVVNGNLYVFGGFADYSAVGTNRAYRYDAASQTWTRIADIPVGLSHAGCAADGRFIYLAGGYPWNATHTAQLYGTRIVRRYDTVTNTWDTIQPLPVERATGAMVMIDHTLHYFGGADINRADVAGHWSLDLDDPGATWTSCAPLPTARNHVGAAVLDGKIYAVGGAKLQDENETALATLEIYDPATDSWTTGPSMPTPRALVESAVAAYDGRIIVAGGENYYKGFTNEVTAFDPVNGAWSQLTHLPDKRLAGILVVLNDQLVFTTGYFNAFNGTTWAATLI